MSRLIQVPMSEVMDLGIPQKAIRFYAIYCDTASVDTRRVLRHIRRARKTACANSLRDWWRRRLNAMERRL